MIQAQYLKPGDLLNGSPVQGVHHLKRDRVRVVTESRIHVLPERELVDSQQGFGLDTFWFRLEESEAVT